MIVAVDTGGTKTLIARFDRNGHKQILKKFATPRDYHEYVAHVCQAIKSAGIAPDAIDALVVALPGTIEDGRLVRMSNLDWRDIDIASDLATSLATQAPIFVENDAHLGALGEVRPLEDAPRHCLYLTISTGINGGSTIDGRLNTSLASAELGHMMLEHEGTLTRWENFASGRALTRQYGKLASEIDDDQTWQIITNNIAKGLVALMPILRPDLIIIGGGVGTHFAKFEHHLQKILDDTLPDYYSCPVVKAKHPEEAVLYGCYYYAIDQLAG